MPDLDSTSAIHGRHMPSSGDGGLETYRKSDRAPIVPTSIALADGKCRPRDGWLANRLAAARH